MQTKFARLFFTCSKFIIVKVVSPKKKGSYVGWGWRFSYSFTYQGTSIRRQRRDLFGLRIKLKLAPITISLTTQR